MSLGTRSINSRMGTCSWAPTSTRITFICPTRWGSTFYNESRLR